MEHRGKSRAMPSRIVRLFLYARELRSCGSQCLSRIVCVIISSLVLSYVLSNASHAACAYVVYHVSLLVTAIGLLLRMYPVHYVLLQPSGSSSSAPVHRPQAEKHRGPFVSLCTCEAAIFALYILCMPIVCRGTGLCSMTTMLPECR